MVWLVCELGMQLQMRQSNCNGAAGRTFCTAVIVVCLVRYVMVAKWSMVLVLCVACLCSWIAVSGFVYDCLVLMTCDF